MDLFDRLHRDVGVNQEPLFWLEYSLLMTAADDLGGGGEFHQDSLCARGN